MNELELTMIGIMTGIGYELAMTLPELLLKYKAPKLEVIPISEIEELINKATVAVMSNEEFTKALKKATALEEPNSEN